MRYALSVAMLLGIGCGRTHIDLYYGATTTGAAGTAGTTAGTTSGHTAASTGATSAAATSGATGTASSGTGTTGATTGGTSGTTSGCTGQPVGELGACGTACCETGLTCDSATSLCQRSCKITSDCPLLGTACGTDDFCDVVTCSATPAAGGGGGVGAPCLMADQTIGSCLLFEQGSVNGFTCVSPGTSPDTCSPTATRGALVTACGLGFACAIAPVTAGMGDTCDEECDPAVGPSDGCQGTAPDVQCVTSPVDSRIGYCLYANQSTSGTTGTSSSGTTGGTTSGTTTGGSSGTSGTTSGGTCLPEFTPCNPTGPGPTCGCGRECVFEPLRNGDVCETPCSATSQCPTAFTVCNGTSCTVNLCGAAAGNGTLDGTCNAAGQNDGTCVGAIGLDGGAFGLCYQGGTASGTDCAFTADRSDPSGLCAPGYFCGPTLSGTGFGSECYYLCNPSDPNAASHCAGEGFSTCMAIPRDPNIGFCQ